MPSYFLPILCVSALAGQETPISEELVPVATLAQSYALSVHRILDPSRLLLISAGGAFDHSDTAGWKPAGTGATGIGVEAVGNIGKEFWPDIRKAMHR
jgi:hypothetical protein